MKTKICILILLMFACTAYSADSVDDALSRLTKVKSFAFGPVGVAGIISQGEKDYRSILSAPSALQVLERLYATGSIEAKCYALVGIRAVSPERFKELSSLLESEKSEVVTMKGCLISNESVGIVIERIASGAYK